MTLDGPVQTTEDDEFIHHEMLAQIPLIAHGNAKRVLIIGGGFHADYAQEGLNIDEFCAPTRSALASLLNDWYLIAEPGRFLVSSAVTSVTTITGKSIRNDYRWYYLDDDTYGSYSGQLFDHSTYSLQLFSSELEAT